MMFQSLALFGGVAFLSSAVNAVVYNVTLGSSTGSLAFSPNNISSVAAGDVINFLYLSKNHSAVQSSFASPCKPLDGGLKMTSTLQQSAMIPPALSATLL